ncbi:MAG: Uncharacterized protein G01um10147_608 [Microgenomates group bacterium Gr01-1014_7]|nr:MAG: Uncharacterized protein G01um10147_608 [Microgenomates group bacterium Gr01-1014_7]
MKERGVSLIESLMVIVAVAVIIFLIANIPNAISLMTKSNHLSLAREIALKQLEDKRTTSYINLVNGTTAIADSRFGLLPQGAGTVIVSDCDPLVCTNGEQVKKITVAVSWKDNNKTQDFKIDTFIGEGGLNQ